MKRAILQRTGFTIESVAPPKIASHEVLVSVTHCGVCSDDLHLYQHKNTLAEQTLALGHEVIGRVAEVGDKVAGFKKGDWVTAVGGEGGYAEQFVAQERSLTKVSPNLPIEMQMGEPIACCVHAVNRLSLSPEMRVAIVGCGFMGLVCQRIIQLRGCSNIVAFDLQKYRRDMAIKLGARSSADPHSYVIEDAEKGGFDVVIEAAGVENALTFCGDIIAHHGQMLIVGYHQSHQGLREVNMQRWNYKAIDVLNGHVRRMHEKVDAMYEGICLCLDGLLDISPLLKTYALNEIEQAFQDLSDPHKHLFKAVIKVEQE